MKGSEVSGTKVISVAMKQKSGSPALETPPLTPTPSPSSAILRCRLEIGKSDGVWLFSLSLIFDNQTQVRGTHQNIEDRNFGHQSDLSGGCGGRDIGNVCRIFLLWCYRMEVSQPCYENERNGQQSKKSNRLARFLRKQELNPFRCCSRVALENNIEMP